MSIRSCSPLRGSSYNYRFFGHLEQAHEGSPVRFLDEGHAATFLSGLSRDPANLSALRRLYAHLAPGEDSSALDDDRILEGLSRQFSEEHLRAVRCAVPVRGPYQKGESESVKKRASLEEQKHWIQFQIVDEETGEPVAGVSARVKLPTGEVREVTSDSQGRIKVQGLPQGSWDLHHLEFSEILEVVKSS
jgi:hypothetical protein